MLKIGITGVPGSGKTTMARAVASKCQGVIGLEQVELVQEYARRYISKHGKIENIFEQYRILEKQLEWEQSVCNDKLDIMITDSPVFLGFNYSCELPKNDSKEVMFFNDIFKKMVSLNYPVPRYDAVFHLGLELKPLDDGIRPPQHFDENWRKKADMMIRATMNIFKPYLFYTLEQEDLNQRAEFCINRIKSLLKKNPDLPNIEGKFNGT
jgi:nicotinamide riboside kinase